MAISEQARLASLRTVPRRSILRIPEILIVAQNHFAQTDWVTT
jgi:hypothetical protein